MILLEGGKRFDEGQKRKLRSAFRARARFYRIFLKILPLTTAHRLARAGLLVSLLDLGAAME
jgi:hypothetical protein